MRGRKKEQEVEEGQVGKVKEEIFGPCMKGEKKEKRTRVNSPTRKREEQRIQRTEKMAAGIKLKINGKKTGKKSVSRVHEEPESENIRITILKT